MPNVFLILCGLVIMAMVGLWLGLAKCLVEIEREQNDSLRDLERAVLRGGARDGDPDAVVRDGKEPGLAVPQARR